MTHWNTPRDWFEKTRGIKNVTSKAAKASWVWRCTGKSSTCFCNLAAFQTENSEIINYAPSHLDFGSYQPWWPSHSTWFVQASCRHVFLCRPLVQPDTSGTDLQMANDWQLPATTPPPEINSKSILNKINKSDISSIHTEKAQAEDSIESCLPRWRKANQFKHLINRLFIT